MKPPTGSIFSAGVDLFRVLEEGAPYLAEFLPALSSTVRRLFTYPQPMVAAVNGHAIAGGCILAAACDRRIMADCDGRVGMPELLVGVPFPPEPLEIVRAAVPVRWFSEVMMSGALYQRDAAVEHGLVE